MAAIDLQLRSSENPRRAALDHELAIRLAVTEYDRLRPRADPPTGKRVEGRQAVRGATIDALTALQVAKNAELSTAELVQQMRLVGPKAARARRRIPGLVRNRKIPEPQSVGEVDEWWTFGYLFDVILTRDPFMHRIDIARATGLPPVATSDHEGVVVDDVVREWAGRHGKPVVVELSGPAGGRWDYGDGERIALDALDFCRPPVRARISDRPAQRGGPVLTGGVRLRRLGHESRRDLESEPFGHEVVARVDVCHLEPAQPGLRELVWGEWWHHDDLAHTSDELTITDREQCLPGVDEERLRVRMLVKCRTLAIHVCADHDEGDAGAVTGTFELREGLGSRLRPIDHMHGSRS